MSVDRYELWIRGGHKCGICRRIIEHVEVPGCDIDHIAPKSLPFLLDEIAVSDEERSTLKHSIYNLRLTHPHCNRSRGNNISMEAAQGAWDNHCLLYTSPSPRD